MATKWEYNTLTKLIDGSWVRAKPGCDDVVQYTEEELGVSITLLIVLHILGEQGWEVCAPIDNDVYLLKREK
jgi:hypothetical protein